MCATRRSYRLFDPLFLVVFAFSRSAAGTCHCVNYAHNIHSIACCGKTAIFTEEGIDLAKNKIALISVQTFEGQKNPKNVHSLKLLFLQIRIGFLLIGKLLKYLTTLTSDKLLKVPWSPRPL